MEIVNRVVSSESEELILVDAQDRPVGRSSKAAAHDGDGQLHRAFSVFLFNARGELLLQQRGREKRLWPGYWSNSCCSHPRIGESMEIATHEREIEALRFMPAGEVADALEEQPAIYTPWFKMEWQALTERHADALARYAQLT